MPETDSDLSSDASMDTARFQAFATRRDDELPAPWRMRAEGSKIGILACVVLIFAILGVILGFVLVG
jgi:hypothetical protein